MIQTKLDDRDDQIQYSDGWGVAGSEHEYKGTTTSTATKGAKFTFEFNGTSVSVFGTLPEATRPSLVSVHPHTSYTVDGGDPVFFSKKLADSIQYRIPFFVKGKLTNGTHTLVGTCVNDGSQVYIDYLIVGAPDNPPIDVSDSPPDTGPPSSESSESVSSPPVSITSPYSQPPAASSAASSSISSPNLTPHIATIIGGIAGGFVLVFIVLALFLWYCRWKRIEYMMSIRRSFSLSSRDSQTSSESLSKSDRDSLVSLPSDIIIYREGRRSLQSQVRPRFATE
ncbi:hypothetical protein EYR40_010249 [Pleurotus pulmonarius]|nr:hypothetical protein EYR36_010358 [Pleurotus pulmonarius]KAF4588696.1 hypothetical protein EYR40_010249 [Pleurotus pulmonarius]